MGLSLRKMGKGGILWQCLRGSAGAGNGQSVAAGLLFPKIYPLHIYPAA